MRYKLAFIGFGTVGQGLAEILRDKEKVLKVKYDFEYSVVAISDLLKGSIYDENGLDLSKLLSVLKETGKIENYAHGIKGWDSIKTIKETNADIVIEVTYTDIKTGEPALTHFKTALEDKKHVVTSNKGPVALAYKELSQLAKEKGVLLRFEGTVLSGTPVLNLGFHCLAGAEIREIKGILNGTTNFILTEMEAGQSYADALKKAQQLGYAEAKPDADVEGWDALAKVLILANTLMGTDLKVADVERRGITDITPEHIQAAKAEVKRWKLIGRVIRNRKTVTAKVSPEKIPLNDPLAGVSGATNALTFVTDLLGEVTIVGPGAGKFETGFALLSDLLDVHRRLTSQ